MAGNISDPMLVEVPQVQVSDLGKLFENSEFPAIDIDQALVYSLPLVNRFRRIIVREGVLLRSATGGESSRLFGIMGRTNQNDGYGQPSTPSPSLSRR